MLQILILILILITNTNTNTNTILILSGASKVSWWLNKWLWLYY